jgi:hypothetical protein
LIEHSGIASAARPNFALSGLYQSAVIHSFGLQYSDPLLCRCTVVLITLLVCALVIAVFVLVLLIIFMARRCCCWCCWARYTVKDAKYPLPAKPPSVGHSDQVTPLLYRTVIMVGTPQGPDLTRHGTYDDNWILCNVSDNMATRPIHQQPDVASTSAKGQGAGSGSDDDVTKERGGEHAQSVVGGGGHGRPGLPVRSVAVSSAV